MTPLDSSAFGFLTYILTVCATAYAVGFFGALGAVTALRILRADRLIHDVRVNTSSEVVEDVVTAMAAKVIPRRGPRGTA